MQQKSVELHGLNYTNGMQFCLFLIEYVLLIERNESPLHQPKFDYSYKAMMTLLLVATQQQQRRIMVLAIY